MEQKKRKTKLRRKPSKTPIFHNDRGIHYASRAYWEWLKTYGIQQSMSRKGTPYDDAVAENFFSCLKRELIHLKQHLTRAAAQNNVFAYLEPFYTPVRPHSSLGWISPPRLEAKPHVSSVGIEPPDWHRIIPLAPNLLFSYLENGSSLTS